MRADARAQRLFGERFGSDPVALVRVPGRVNLLGEHTDYNDGWVLPAAIDRELWVAVAPAGDGVVEAVSEGSGEAVTFPVADVASHARLKGWGAYVQGVAWALQAAGYDLAGWRGAVASDIPVGAGLSSSAALEVAVARAFHAVAGFSWEPIPIARVAQRAENDWVGVASGIMDQVACAAGRAGHALLLDCRAVTYTPVPVGTEVALVVLDTGTRRELAHSGYVDRRRECEQAAQALGVAALRDATVERLQALEGGLDAVLLRRARHVVTDNARALAGAEALRSGDLVLLGALLDASHHSLRDDFEVSSHELDRIVDAARAAGCYGARMTGGGFAGCAVALVPAGAVEDFAVAVTDAYRQATGLDATVHGCVPVGGASHEPLAVGGGAGR